MPSNGRISRDQSPEIRDLAGDALRRLRQNGDGITPAALCDRYDPRAVSDRDFVDLIEAIVDDPDGPLETDDDGSLVLDGGGVREYTDLLAHNDTDPFERMDRV